MSIERFINGLSAKRPEAVAHIEHVEGRPAVYGELNPPLAEPVASALANAGVTRLFSHQTDAISYAREGLNVLQVTPTASGKTIGFMAPVLEAMLADDGASALFLYPTKALSQDQLRNLNRLLELSPPLGRRVKPGVYDGDTPVYLRRKIRGESNAVITNPDMLHAGILPHHAGWARFLAGLKYVVIDELHAYRGIFGSNVANVIRRLERVLTHYGAAPRYLMASATIANPGEHAEKLVGAPVAVVAESGSPRGERYFVLLNPPFVDRALGRRRSANVEATHVMADLVRESIQTITFARSRVVAELIYRYAVEELGPRFGKLLSPYRGGYLPEERRAIEKKLFNGELMGVTSTNALELGIDIGGLDAAILVGFPGSIASVLQQSGRAGRRTDASLAVLVAYDDPVDQYLCRHPEYIFGNTPEAAIIDPDNPYIAAGHVRCAAMELPLSADELADFGTRADGIADILTETGDLNKKGDKYFWVSTEYPAIKMSLRSGADNTVTIVDAKRDNEVIGTLDYESALEHLYPEAVYLQGGETYFVRELDLNQKVAYLEQRDVDYYTQAMVEATILLEDELERNDLGTCICGLADVRVTWATVGFKKIKFYQLDSIGWAALDMPTVELETVALYLAPSPDVVARVRTEGYNPFDGLLGYRNSMLAVIPLLAMCDPRDVGGVVDSSNLGVPTVFVYDKFSHGLGYAESAYERIEQVLYDCRDLIISCGCAEGCPACVGVGVFSPDQVTDPDLRTGRHIPVKAAARALAEELLG
jgi:DEAD/DEAH box helicase domain-containing protein